MSNHVEIVTKYLSEGYDLGFSIRWTPRALHISCTLTKNGKTYSFGTTNDSDLMLFLLDLETFPDPYTGKPRLRVPKNKASLAIAEEGLADFLYAEKPCLPVVKVASSTSEIDRQKISNEIEAWVQCESVLKESRTRLPLVFYNVLVLHNREGVITQSIFEKDRTKLADIYRLRAGKDECQWVKCFSAILLCPKITRHSHRDCLVGVLLYDVFSRQIEAGIIGTANSAINIYGEKIRRGRELSDLAILLTEKVLASPSAILLSSPFRDSEFTPTPWIVYSISAQLPCDYSGLEPQYSLLPCEALVFGDPGIPRERSSFDFKKSGQTAYIGLEIEETQYVIRFDCQGGEPKFHIHYEIRTKSWEKEVLSHFPISLENMWNLDRNLSLSFLSAMVFDGRFNKIVKPNIKDLDLVGREDIAALPLRAVMMIGLEEKWLRENPRCMSVLQKYWSNRNYSPRKEEEESIKALRQRGLLINNNLSKLATVILVRNSKK